MDTGTYTRCVYRHAWRFRKDYRELADAARPMLRGTGLRFVDVAIGCSNGEVVKSARITCESSDRLVQVLVCVTPDGPAAQMTIDEPMKPWQRRA